MKLKLSSCSCARVWKHKETPQDTRRAILVATDKVLNVMQKPKSLWRWSVNPWPIGTMWIFTSLVPRPSHHPVFWSFAVCKNGGGRPGPFYHMNDISVYLSRQRGEGVPHRKNELEADLLVSAPSAGDVKRKVYCSWFKTKNVCTICVLSIWDSSHPPSLYLQSPYWGSLRILQVNGLPSSHRFAFPNSHLHTIPHLLMWTHI